MARVSTLSGSVGEAVFSPDGRRFATAMDDGTILIWDTRMLLPARR